MRTYVVWIPILDRDEGAAVPSASKHVGVSPQYFDGAKAIGNGLAKAFELDEPVWDAFFFYPPGATFTATGLPVPKRVIAQYNGVVVGTLGSHPPSGDQTALPANLRGRAIVIGEQKDFHAILERVARAFVAELPR